MKMTERPQAERLGIPEHIVTRIQDIKLGSKLGEGAFGKVYRCKVGSIGDAAAKQIQIKNLTATVATLLEREVSCWAQMDHPHCLKLMGVVFQVRRPSPLCYS